MKKISCIILISIGIIGSVFSQKLTHEIINDFMNSGSLTVISLKDNVRSELAHSLELLPYPMGWVPGKDLENPPSGSFQVTGSYVAVSEGKDLFIVLMVPGNMKNMNIRVDKIVGETLIGELLIPEFMFYDPQNPPKLPPPTYIHISKEPSRLKHLFSEQIIFGKWQIDEIEGCSFPSPYFISIKSKEESIAISNGEEIYLNWKLSPSGGYVYLEPDDFSERIIGILIDELTIEAYSDVNNCKFIFKKIN
jgi:hypothetical protein